MLVCIDIVLRGSGRYTRLLELTAISFYSQLPYLLGVLVYVLGFHAVDTGGSVGLLQAAVKEILQLYQSSLRESLLYNLMRNFGHAFQA